MLALDLKLDQIHANEIKGCFYIYSCHRLLNTRLDEQIFSDFVPLIAMTEDLDLFYNAHTDELFKSML